MHLNTGQIKDVPKNPRFIKDERYEALKKSIEDDPEMLQLRELVAYDNNGELVVILGNMRYRAMKKLGYKDAPVKVLPPKTDAKKLHAYIQKDNIAFGQNDWDLLGNEWDIEELQDFGLECEFLEDNEDIIENEEEGKNDKIEDSPLFSPKNLKDTVRTTIVADNKDIDFIISDLVKHKSFVRLKEQKTSLGYVGNIVNLITNNGLIAEIQVITPYMIYAKESPKIAKQILGESMWNKIMQKTKLEGGLGHKFYEQWRLLNPKSKEAIEIAKKSVEYYRHFKN